jgi:pyruvate/2-oxoglutarate dehydrogenase complex dihydrolipoamide dehydrogenase (E3) component
MERVQKFDLCVLGAGSAGYSAAETARELGKSVALVEGKGPLAGLCILRGCMPAKTLLHTTDVAHIIETAPEVGVNSKDVSVDLPAAIERKRRIIKDFAKERVKDIEQFPLFRGNARFSASDELSVDEQKVRASKFVVATGSCIKPPAIPGLSEVAFRTSDDFLEISEPAESIIVLGGGPVGCEFAQYLARLGVRVTLLQQHTTLLMKEDPDIGQALQRGLEKDGVRVVTGAQVLNVRSRGGRRQAEVERDGERFQVEAAEILLASGRQPNVDTFALEKADIRYAQSGIEVDDYLQTTNANVYAAGDVLGRRCLLHLAVHQGRLAVKNAFGAVKQRMNYDLQSARSVFTDPEVAVAGLSELDCRARGIAYHAAQHPFEEHGKAITANEEEGFVKMLAAPDGRILGLTFVGAGASDLIHEAVSLLYFRASVEDVLAMPHLHPTMAEIITYPAEKLRARN